MRPTIAQAEGLFTAPGLAVAGAAAVAVPVAIHLLTRWRRRPQPWAAMRFLLAAYERHKRRLRFEQWLLLLLRCLIVLLLGLALADPAVAGWARLFGSPQGRVVWLVMDDGLSTRADAGGKRRFDRLRERARAALEPMAAGTRVGIVRASRPPGADPWLAPTAEAGRVRRALDDLAATHRAPRLDVALKRVNRALERTPRPGAGRHGVIVASDFARGPKGLSEGERPELDAIAANARIRLTPPAPAASNRQIVDVTLRDPLLLTRGDERATVGVEATVRRFAQASRSEPVRVRFAVLGPDGEAMAERSRESRWLEGQRKTRLSTEIPLEPETLRRLRDGEPAGAMVRAALASDALPADDRAWARLELRRRLRVAVLGRTAGTGPPTPARWLALALSPGEGESKIEPIVRPPDTPPERLGDLDGLWITRPDRVPAAAWRRLAKSARAGAAVVVMAPPEETTSWLERMADAFGLDAEGKPMVEEAEGEAGWPLDVERAVPEPLGILASDWRKLLRPVRMHKRLAGGPSGGEAWLALADGRPLLAKGALGAGHWMLARTALAPRWSNLATKPLFVPLVHESVRGLVAQSTPAARLGTVRVGSRPALGRPWSGAERLVPPDGGDAIPLTRDADRSRPKRLLPRPGIYRPDPQGPGFAAHVRPDLGDLATRPRSGVTGWFDPIPVRWLDEPARRAASGERWRLGWPLLWLLLGLVLTETGLARWMSRGGRAS